MIRAAIHHRYRGFELSVDFASPGPVLGIFGPSGSGKSTLLHIIAGLLQPERAEVVVGGRALVRRPGGVCLPPERRQLALVTQDPLLFPHISTRANLCYAPGARAELASARGAHILEVLRLGALLERAPATLSGGERQRVALGRALLARPTLLLLDEPTAALDAGLSREALALLGEVKRSLGVPMLFVTHRAAELISLAEDCLLLEAGKLVGQGPPLELLGRPQHLGVASLVGADNLLRLNVLSHDPVGGISQLDLGGVALAAPLCEAAVGAAVDVGIRADDLMLCLEAPRGISARNALPATILAARPIGHEVLVELKVGAEKLVARVTPAAHQLLELAPGQAIVVLLKTTACHLLSAGDRS